MATPIIRRNSIIGVEEEVTEGTYLAPTADTSYIQPLADGFDLNMAREVIDRNTLNASPGKETPRLGIRSATTALPVEYRGSGTEGAVPDFDPLLKSALGAVRTISTQSTTKAGNSAVVLQIEDADISKYSVGDCIVVLESGAHEVRPISEVDTTGGTANITLAIALDNGAPADNVVISKAVTYLTASTGHPSLSVSYYWANEIRQAAVGARVTSLSLDNYTVGQIASLSFGLESLSYEPEIDGVAPHAPVFDSGIPPILLKACIFRDSTSIPVNTFTLSLANTLGFTTSLCDENGRQSSRVTDREITGTINPYKDDTAVEYFTDWDAGTEFSLFAYAFNPSAVTGEYDLGSVTAVWLPQCFTTEFQTQGLEGLLVDQMAFRATRGSDGSSEEMFLGLI